MAFCEPVINEKYREPITSGLQTTKKIGNPSSLAPTGKSNEPDEDGARSREKMTCFTAVSGLNKPVPAPPDANKMLDRLDIKVAAQRDALLPYLEDIRHQFNTLQSMLTKDEQSIEQIDRRCERLNDIGGAMKSLDLIHFGAAVLVSYYYVQICAVGSTQEAGPQLALPGTQSDLGTVNRALVSELVMYYRFYSFLFEKLIGDRGRVSFKEFIFAPLDVTYSLLVLFGGFLGAFLRYFWELEQRWKVYSDPFSPLTGGISLREITVRLLLASMCALTIYVLARISFIAVTERVQQTSGLPLSPFVIAFMAVASGTFAEEAFVKISEAAKSTLGKASRQEKRS
jgi:hypothetical protein